MFFVFFVFFGDFYTIQIDFLDTQIGDLGTQKVDLDGQKCLFRMVFFSCGWSLDGRLFFRLFAERFWIVVILVLDKKSKNPQPKSHHPELNFGV